MLGTILANHRAMSGAARFGTYHHADEDRTRGTKQLRYHTKEYSLAMKWRRAESTSSSPKIALARQFVLTA